MIFQDRYDAGKRLGEIVAASGLDLTGYSVVGIARGGVIIGEGIAKATSLPLRSFYIDDCILDKNHRVFVSAFKTMTVWERGKIHDSRFPRSFFREIPQELMEVPGFTNFYEGVLAKHGRYRCLNKGEVPKSVILCDDGLVSGKSFMAAIDALRSAGTEKIIIAVPVVPNWVNDHIDDCPVLVYRRSKMADIATGMYYYEFEDVSDKEISTVMDRALAA